MRKILIAFILMIFCFAKIFAQIDSAKILFANGVKNYNAKEYSEAYGNFNKVIAIDSNYAEAYYYKGLIFVMSFKTADQALFNFDKAIQLGLINAEIFCERGTAKAYLSKDSKEVFKDYSKAIEIDSTYAGAYINRALMWEAIYSDSTNLIITKIWKEYPDSIISDELLDTPNFIYQKAINDLNMAIKYEPNNAIAYWNRSQAKKAMGDKTGACEDMKKALEINYKPYDQQFYINYCY